ncbi:MAG: hypothetical protein AAF639_10675 [Chloroflexota bacterium]
MTKFTLKFTRQSLQHLKSYRKSEQQTIVEHSIDEFDMEIEMLRNNEELMAYLDELFAEEAVLSLEDIEQELELVDS